MIGVLIVTHGDLGKELLYSAELIVGKQRNVATLGLFHGDSIDGFSEKVSKTIKELEEGEGVLVFVDLYGGSPSNATALNMKKFFKNMQFECITGVNLPMVLEALMLRSSYNLKKLKEHCIEAGLLGIKDLYQQLYSEENIKKVVDGR
ncbi:PTS sugar transporter subunit IIA [Biomaibacter acetigenes]|jgi:PTS system mannose-specific IIA component|uniref:PTS sugar transporter subunit IIA n=1 Tax=Biomaibacter acetigenes TaxID=2316383 RepID=A0A3G2R6Z2_9FIRM|nr:PTS sugar transporter subunit IIA [Biomaibacter acetigenes]AYO31324.1 PTS sugar transporter subunit IIA [Biomaibacter acetigenes]MDN5311237.1 mannose system component [Thermoanaerobacteraceae bacterium]